MLSQYQKCYYLGHCGHDFFTTRHVRKKGVCSILISSRSCLKSARASTDEGYVIHCSSCKQMPATLLVTPQYSHACWFGSH